jgi:hypothetical protein
MIRFFQFLLWALMIGLFPCCALGLLVLVLAPEKFDLSQRASLILASLATTVFWTSMLSK